MRSYYTTREIMRGTSLTCRRSKFHRRPWRHEARYKARQAEETYHPTAGQRLEHTPQNGEQTARASAHAGWERKDRILATNWWWRKLCRCFARQSAPSAKRQRTCGSARRPWKRQRSWRGLVIWKAAASKDQERRRQCVVCRAAESKFCICGASFMQSHNKKALQKFAEFVRRAPVVSYDEAHDNVELLEAFRST